MYSERIRSQILSGCLADFPGYLYGVYQGYHISVQRAEMRYKILMVKINASSEIDINNANLAQFLMNQKNISKRIIKVQVYPNVIMLQIEVGIMQGKIPEILNRELVPIISYLASNGYRSGCEQCGSCLLYTSRCV